MAEQSLANGRVSMVAGGDNSPLHEGKYKDLFLDTDMHHDVHHEHDENYDELREHQREMKARAADDCSPEEKRQRFLERNRAAASRCRQKRKLWVNQLESKSHDLMQTNNVLMNEINALRREVAQLKALLLAHKDCPVTAQQKALLGDMTPGSYVAAVADGQIIAIQQLPNGVVTSQRSAEEVATSALTDMAMGGRTQGPGG